MESGTLPLSSPLRREGLYSLKAFAPMQYRHEIGHALANFAFAADTKRKTSVPLFFASTGGLRLPSFMPILHLSLQFIDCYSPQLHRLSASIGLRLPLLQTYYTSVASSYWFLQFFASQVCKYRARIVLFQVYRLKITPHYIEHTKKYFSLPKTA